MTKLGGSGWDVSQKHPSVWSSLAPTTSLVSKRVTAARRNRQFNFVENGTKIPRPHFNRHCRWKKIMKTSKSGTIKSYQRQSLFIVLFREYKIVHVDFSQEAWRMKGLLAINCSFFKTAVKPSFTCEFAEVGHREWWICFPCKLKTRFFISWNSFICTKVTLEKKT